MSVELLAGIRALPGVIGCCLVDAALRVVAHHLPPPYEPVLLVSVIERLSGVFEMHASLEDFGMPRALLARMSDGVLFARQYDTGLLVVLAGQTVNMAMVSVAANSLQSRLGAVSSPPDMMTGQPRMTPALTPPPVRGGTVLAPQSQTFSLKPTPRPSDVPVVPIESLRKVGTLLTQHLGPLASALLKREIEALGYTPDALPIAMADTLVGKVAVRISDPRARAAFSQAAFALIVPR